MILNVLVNDKKLIKAKATDITNSINILNQQAIEEIHKNIYEIVPDIEQINEQFTDATNAPQDLDDNQSGIIGSIPAHAVFDLSLAYRYQKWTLETGLNNLLDEAYFTQRATGYPGPGIIPALPQSFYATLQLKF